MAGRPRTRLKEMEKARKQLALMQAREGSEREQELMHGRRFEGHNPPSVDEPDFDAIEHIVEADPDARTHISQLWPKAYDALEHVLDDPDAPATSKVAASRIVQAAVASARDAEAAAMPQRIVFETAAFVP